MKDVIVVVLAGGSGKRFWPIQTSKSLVPFLGKPLLVHNLEMLANAGFQKVIVVTNPRDINIINGLRIPKLTIQPVVQKESRGMGDALMAAKPLIVGSPCLVMNAEDVAEDRLYKDIYKAIDGHESFVVGKNVENYVDVGYLRMEGDRLVEIVEKPGAGHEPSSMINFVFDYFPSIDPFLHFLEQTKSNRDDVYEKSLSKYFLEFPTHVVTYDGYWQPLKYPWHVLDLMGSFLTTKCAPHKGNNVVIKENVVIEGPVWIEDNVRIFENTKIVGPCYIGRDTIIGNNNIIRHSHIGAHCMTGFNTDITRSYVGPDCWFHSNYIGDSVLEGNVSMGSGAVLANLRLDEGDISSIVGGSRMNTKRNKLGSIIGRDVRVGVNASIMPGAKIGSGSFVGAGIVLDGDIPDESFCLMKSTISVIKNTRAVPNGERAEFKKHL